MPSHHQSTFFHAIRGAGIDLVVHYYGQVRADRKSLGWSDIKKLPVDENFVNPGIRSVAACKDWRNRIHVIPGYGTKFLRVLVRFLSKERIPWIHWTEAARPGLRWWLSYPIKRWHAGMVNRYALGAFAIGEMAKRDFIRWGIKGDKVYLLPYAIAELPNEDISDTAIEAFAKKHSMAFLFVGSLDHRKGIDVLLSAFHRVLMKSPSSCLILVGKDASNGQYKKNAKEMGIAERVLFRGVIPSGVIGAAFRNTDVLVLPSRFDGWGMVLNEGASAGKALIATETCGAAQHLICQGENGFRIPSNNAEALAEAMMRYAAEPSLAKQHGIHSRRIFQNYSPESNANRLVQHLEHMLRGSKRY